MAALTAYAKPEDRNRVLDAGFRAHLAKPLDPADIAALVAELARAGRHVTRRPRMRCTSTLMMASTTST